MENVDNKMMKDDSYVSSLQLKIKKKKKDGRNDIKKLEFGRIARK